MLAPRLRVRGRLILPTDIGGVARILDEPGEDCCRAADSWRMRRVRDSSSSQLSLRRKSFCQEPEKSRRRGRSRSSCCRLSWPIAGTLRARQVIVATPAKKLALRLSLHKIPAFPVIGSRLSGGLSPCSLCIIRSFGLNHAMSPVSTSRSEYFKLVRVESK